MNIEEMFELQDCPECGGPGLLEMECQSGYMVSCLDCGGHTVIIDFKSEEGKMDAAKRAVELWNLGKTISSAPGE